MAGSAALALWVEQYHLSATFVGLIGAFSANAISAGIGALVGGRLCDKYGRKRIYQFDMLFYAFGMSWLVFANHPWMIVVGFILVGLAVGADIPASWSLIAEMAPDGERVQSILDQFVRDTALRLTWQASSANKVSAFLERIWKRKGKDFTFGQDPRAATQRDPNHARTTASRCPSRPRLLHRIRAAGCKAPGVTLSATAYDWASAPRKMCPMP